MLLDENKLVAPPARQSTGSASMISDDEMCRINIEAASNLAQLLHLWQTDEDAFFRLLHAAYTWLPMPPTPSAAPSGHSGHAATGALYSPGVACPAKIVATGGNCHSGRQPSDHPHRALANLLINVTYRNGLIENLHAGKTPAYPLDKRRGTNREAGKIVRFAAERLGAVVAALPVWHKSLQEMLPLRLRSGQAWPEGTAVFWPHAAIPGIDYSRNPAYLVKCARPG